MVLLCRCLRAASLVALFLNPTFAAEKIEFKKEEITLGDKKIIVELADNDKLRAYGLMNRDSLSKNEGMLFIFENEQVLGFWMKNTFIDLAIGFFDKSQTLVDVQEMKKTSVVSVDFPTYSSKKPAQYALEMNKGWFTKNKIKLGSRFSFKEKPKSSPSPSSH